MLQVSGVSGDVAKHETWWTVLAIETVLMIIKNQEVYKIAMEVQFKVPWFD
jgi:hypothetical protein